MEKYITSLPAALTSQRRHLYRYPMLHSLTFPADVPAIDKPKQEVKVSKYKIHPHRTKMPAKGILKKPKQELEGRQGQSSGAATKEQAQNPGGTAGEQERNPCDTAGEQEQNSCATAEESLEARYIRISSVWDRFKCLFKRKSSGDFNLTLEDLQEYQAKCAQDDPESQHIEEFVWTERRQLEPEEEEEEEAVSSLGSVPQSEQESSRLDSIWLEETWEQEEAQASDEAYSNEETDEAEEVHDIEDTRSVGEVHDAEEIDDAGETEWLASLSRLSQLPDLELIRLKHPSNTSSETLLNSSSTSSTYNTPEYANRFKRISKKAVEKFRKASKNLLKRLSKSASLSRDLPNEGETLSQLPLTLREIFILAEAHQSILDSTTNSAPILPSAPTYDPVIERVNDEVPVTEEEENTILSRTISLQRTPEEFYGEEPHPRTQIME